MKRLLMLSICALAVMALSCGDDDNPVDNDPDPIDTTSDPLFVVRVVDPDGNPVPDIRIGTFNRSPYEPAIRPWTLQFQPHIFGVDFPVAGRAIVWVEDYYRRFIDTILDSTVAAGTAFISWTPVGIDTILPGGYYHLMVEKPTSAGPRPVEDIVMVWDWDFNPIFTLRGTTDSTGELIVDDTLVFPGLLGNPPPYVPDPWRTGDTIRPYFTDSLVIHLSDPNDVYRVEYHPVKMLPEPNAFELVWNPGAGTVVK